ncbi:hypothetical protein BDR07DRAFT_1402014 [Suillus spraguei]|nr:hypothetical protein BDR07DRAFT_1402014 [Suillus spraguei]
MLVEIDEEGQVCVKYRCILLMNIIADEKHRWMGAHRPQSIEAVQLCSHAGCAAAARL